VAGDFVAKRDKRRRRLGIAFERHRDAEDGQRQAPTLELAQNAPHARAGAVLVDRLHAHVARLECRGADDFRQKLLGVAVPMKHAAFASFLVIEDELHAMRVPGQRVRGSAVADEIARIGRVGVRASASPAEKG
jgi:hypothetical protein